MKQMLTGMSAQDLQTFIQGLGEKPFRGRQLFSWIYEKKAQSFDELTELSKTFRALLQQQAEIGALHFVEQSLSPRSQTCKYLFSLKDSLLIESVLIKESARRTLCISSQAGCALDCKFCATAAMGFKRQLTAAEIVDQVICVERAVQAELTNVVFMGMGEPLLNYENVLAAADLINHPDGIAIGHRHIVISTAGVVPAIQRYADENRPYRLAISLNSPFQEERAGIMPVAKKWDIPTLMAAVRYYVGKVSQRPTFEYVMMADLNVSKDHALALKKLLKNIPCKVNLIPYNATRGTFKRPGLKAINQFAEWLKPLSAPVSVRWSKGDDMNAACGQLAGQRSTD
jgi:23S rRNA (adenine2503-C2)-methyltransferase